MRPLTLAGLITRFAWPFPGVVLAYYFLDRRATVPIWGSARCSWAFILILVCVLIIVMSIVRIYIRLGNGYFTLVPSPQHDPALREQWAEYRAWRKGEEIRPPDVLEQLEELGVPLLAGKRLRPARPRRRYS
jgi:hypothetical protein